MAGRERPDKDRWWLLTRSSMPLSEAAGYNGVAIPLTRFQKAATNDPGLKARFTRETFQVDSLTLSALNNCRCPGSDPNAGAKGVRELPARISA